MLCCLSQSLSSFLGLLFLIVLALTNTVRYAQVCSHDFICQLSDGSGSAPFVVALLLTFLSFFFAASPADVVVVVVVAALFVGNVHRDNEYISYVMFCFICRFSAVARSAKLVFASVVLLSCASASSRIVLFCRRAFGYR